MKVTEGDVVAKTKSPIKAVSTKAKTKKAKGRTAATKKQGRKKTAPVVRKKTGDTKKTGPKKKDEKKKKKKERIVVDSNTETTTQNRRSNRNRNNIFSYDESSDGSSIPSEDDIIPYQPRAITRNSRRKDLTTKSAGGDRSKRQAGRSNGDDDDDGDGGENRWQIYDLGVTERRGGGGDDDDEAWNEQYRRLQEFHSVHGHSGVPVLARSGSEDEMEKEQAFATWVSRQRQTFREIRSGYRIASTKEEGRWRRLRVLGFPLNHEAWLWRRTCNELSGALNGRKYDRDTTRLPPPLSEWVHRQEALMDENNSNAVRGGMDPDRKHRLEMLGVVRREKER